MKYTKRISVGQFLKKGTDFKANDLIEIANEGKQIEGQFGTQDVFLIKLSDGREGNVSFNQTTLNNLIDGYGPDSVNWIGKKAKVFAILQNVQGKMINVYYFLHPDSVLDEEKGIFVIPGVSDEGENEIDNADIPF